MKINRHIEMELLRWKSSGSRKPLVLRGARQVGKTFVVNQFSKHFPYAIRVYSGENRVDHLQLPSGKHFFLHSIPFYFLPRLDEVIAPLVETC